MKISRKGIILAGGSGSRLFPLTKVLSKQLLPIYNKPMIYYPLTTLMQANVREILIICTPKDIHQFKYLLGDGNKFGLELSYAIQEEPKGIAHGLLIAEKFIKSNPCILILGDNLFYGSDLGDLLKKASNRYNGATIFSYHVSDPQRYGVVEYKNGIVTNIDEKPKDPKTNFVITGIYFYDNNVFEYAKTLKPSKRNELEITDLNLIYLQQKNLFVEEMNRGFTWLDTGTYNSFMEANNFVHTIEQRQGLMIGCPEEIAYKNKWISESKLISLLKDYGDNCYKNYLLSIMDNK